MTALLKKIKTLPHTSGVYIFLDGRRSRLYIGHATSLRTRVQSYFSSNIGEKRSPLIAEMVHKAKNIEIIETENVLDALFLEVYLIKKYLPVYNTQEKDNKSFLFIGITKEDFPSIKTIRGRNIITSSAKEKYSHIFGPFSHSGVIRDALKLIRRVIPFRDTCKVGLNKKCMNAHIDLCPGVCDGSITKKEYRKNVKRIVMFFEGKRTEVIKELEKDMKCYAKEHQFEKAAHLKKKIDTLRYIQDMNFSKNTYVEGGDTGRIEAYDISHMRAHARGVMVVAINGVLCSEDYRVFSIKKAIVGDDVGALQEVLQRRCKHTEWKFPQIIVVDGGKAQVSRAERVLKSFNLAIPVVGVVKDERHKADHIIGDSLLCTIHKEVILRINSESHRFAISKYRKAHSILK